ncbi:hypothetical protein HK098_001517 [Nowakowskiella sp. JEL0407]|nr:hypothetical protein HK098_001517 [Nowakowskiella sp. JEL0407]
MTNDKSLRGSRDNSRSLDRLNTTSSAASTVAPLPSTGFRSVHASRELLSARSTASSINNLSNFSDYGDGTLRESNKKKLGSIGSMLGVREPSTITIRTIREESEIFTVKFSPTDEYLVAGLGNGDIQVYSLRNSGHVTTLINPGPTALPCTSIVFRPDYVDPKNRNILVAGYADGKAIHWHCTTGQKLGTIEEEDNQINSVHYFRDGSLFATTGSDCCIRVYDSNTQKLATNLFTGIGDVTAGHSNRIFSVKFHPKDPNFLISGGWDNTVQMWDTRTKHSMRSFYGPHICGDSLDFDDTGEKILTGGYSREDQIQIWSWSDTKLLDTIQFSASEATQPTPQSQPNQSHIQPPTHETKRTCMIYSAQFSHGSGSLSGIIGSAKSFVSQGPAQQTTPNRWILAGGGGGGSVKSQNVQYLNEVRMFNSNSKKAIGAVQGFQNAVYSVALSQSDKLMACGGGTKMLYIFDVDQNEYAY